MSVDSPVGGDLLAAVIKENHVTGRRLEREDPIIKLLILPLRQYWGYYAGGRVHFLTFDKSKVNLPQV